MATPALNEETVATVHERVVALLGDQVALAERIETRATWAAGFAAVVLSLTVAVRKLLSDLGSLDQPTQDIAFVVAIVALAAAAGMAVLALWPRAQWHTNIVQVLAWQGMLALPPSVVLDPELRQLSMGLGIALQDNNTRLVRLRASLVLLLVGTLAVALQSGVGIL